MMRNLSRFVFASALSIATSNAANAGYLVLSPIEATVCRTFVVELCKMEIKVDLVQDKNGRVYKLPDYFPEVDEYASNRCWIKIKGGLLNRLMGDIPIFYSYKSGSPQDIKSYTKLDTPSVLTFQCKKT